MFVWLLCIMAALGFATSTRGNVITSGFVEAAFPVPGVSQTTDIEWAPDTSRRLFLAQKNGAVRVMLQNGTLLAAPFATFSPVYTFSECGLVGMCFDPNFLVNRYVYFFVTVSSSEQQILRCQELEGGGVLTTILVRGLPTIGANHDGGGLAVGLDGKLYFSIGDLGNGTGVNADLGSLASKVGRCNLDGTEVVFNPFHDGPGGNNDFIWARGFRNPYKLAIQPGTGLVWVNVAGAAYEQIFAVDKGDHAGWNDYENTQPAGYITPRIKYRTNGSDTRQITAGGAYWHDNVITFTTSIAHGFRTGERIIVSGVFPASFDGTYHITSIPNKTSFTVSRLGAHGVGGGGTATTFAFGGAVTGGCFYNATAFADAYRQNYFFCDFNSGRLNRVTFTANNEVASVEPFVTGIDNAVDVVTGPNGHLYYTSLNGQVVYRLSHSENPQRIAVSPQYLNMAEGGLSVVHARLTSQPASDVIVSLQHTAGSSAITTTNLALTFTPANFAETQPLFFEALADADRAHSQATFTLSSPGYPSRNVFVNAYDPEHGTLAFSGVSRTNNGTRLQIATERRTRLALDTSQNLAVWQPFSTNLSVTNVVTLLDNSPPQSQRFYRARIVR